MVALVQLSGLTQLTNLFLHNVNVDLTDEVPAKQFPSVRWLDLSDISILAEEPVDLTFCLIFSDMFPNIHRLGILACWTKTNIESYLPLFDNLRHHNIWYSLDKLQHMYPNHAYQANE